MTVQWPWALLALLVVPVLLGVWWLARRRRRRAAVRVTSIALVQAALPGRSRWLRRIPAALLVLGLLVLGVGTARPQATVPVASTSATILLALDVSGSMCSTDVDPNRLTVAEKQAGEFIRSQAGGPRIGLVTFGGTAGVLVPPTNDTQQLLDALKGLTTTRGTAIGQAILTSIDAIAEVDPAVAATGAPVTADPKQPYAADAIVVLTDGANTQGVAPLTAAEQAADRRLRVFTIGFGTTKPSSMVCTGQQVDGWYGGGGGGFGGGFGFNRVQSIDERTLRGIADETGGKYYRAQNADELRDALGKLPGTFSVVHKHIDIAAWFAGIGGALIALAVALSLWLGRVRAPRPADARRRQSSIQ